jgi:hypothetical protein
MERVAPPSLNYDNILPLAIESRSNRRTFVPQNGTVFSNTTGATIVRIDVNADSMLDCAHSYLSCEILNESGATNTLSLEQFCPAWIQRLRIESGGVVIEDINEYARLYAMMVLNQCPKDYIVNNLSQQGLYSIPHSTAFMSAGNGFTSAVNDVTCFSHSAVSVTDAGGGTGDLTELQYPSAAQLIVQGRTIAGVVGIAAGVGNQPTAGGLVTNGFNYKINDGAVKKQSFPLLSGFLNMDKYLPLIMMNAGFTIEIHLADARRIGVAMVESGAVANILQAGVEPVWSVRSIEYVAHLIDLDRAFYDRLRMVMEQSGGVLQLAGQTYRHFASQTPANVGPHTISIPARVKSVKSIFATFLANAQRNAVGSFSSSVFQRGNVSSFRFEIGSVRYPQKDVVTGPESLVELQKAFGKLGDYQHQMAYGLKHCFNNGTQRSPHTVNQQSLSAFTIGYDFEAFQRVSLEAGINTADRSLPINLIYSKDGAGAITHVDVFVLCDAIYYINLDGTVSVSV